MLRKWALLLGLLTLVIDAPQCEAGAAHGVKRSRLEVRGGYWNPSGSSEANAGGLVRQSVANVMWSVAYSYQRKENLALTVRLAGLVAEVEQGVGWLGISQGAVVVMPVLFGVRYEWPLPPSPFRPYLAASAGPYFLSHSRNEVSISAVVQEVNVQATLGTYLGGGVDFAIGKRFVLGAGVGYHLLADLAERNFSGPEVCISASFLWGREIARVGAN